MWILINGNPIDGLRFTGPFPSSEEAIEFAEETKTYDTKDWWVAQLDDPANAAAQSIRQKIADRLRIHDPF